MDALNRTIMLMTPGQLVDSGQPFVLADTALADSFRYWTGRSGSRYLFRVTGIHDMAETYGHVVIAARRMPDGRRTALWVGLGGTLEAFADISAAVSAGADEIHVHALAETGRARAEAIGDLREAALNASPPPFQAAA